jgi:ligand-binding sensor domain-containing protein
MNIKAFRIMSKHFLALTLITCIQMPLFAQVAIGQWRDHLPYDKGIMVADAGDWVFSASESGLFRYHKTEGDIVRLSKVSGMSDIGYSAIAWSDDNNTLLVAYKNTNIDIIQDGSIINIPDIKDKPILGNKTIINIHIKDDLAYLATGFAIVVLDLIRHEVKGTYYIGPEGAALNIFDITTSETKLFATTENGVYWASLSGVNLANFENWTRFSDIPLGKYNAGTWFNDRLYVNLEVDNGIDTIYYLQNQQWTTLDSGENETVNSLESSNGVLLVTLENGVAEYDGNNQQLRLADNYGFGVAKPNHAFTDADGTMWIADKNAGLIKHSENLTFEEITVNGPRGLSNTDISVWDGRCYVSSGSLSSTWGVINNENGLYTYKNNQWGNIGPGSFPQTSGFRDFIRVLVDPFDSKRVYASTWGRGLVEYYDDQFVASYDTTYSVWNANNGSSNIRICGLAIDRNTGTLWVTRTEVERLLYAKETDGTWHSFDIEAVAPITLGDIAIDDSGQKWIVAPRGTGLVVYNDNNSLAFADDDRSIKLTTGVGKGNLNSNDIFTIVADLDGEIWVGTNNGISVFYSPESLFDGGNFDSQQILVEQDGYVQYLLESEAVTDIVIDGANRKWIGTANAGVFLMSEDGTEEVYHFTTENSPIFSNQITSLGVDQLSGEVFIGTDKGIISFRGDATWGTSEFVNNDVYAYPNPVAPGYEGLIAIKGLVRDADIKISDAAGNVVFATTANGGQATWDGNKLTGGRAQSGVYLVFASNEDGKQTFVTKILFIN